jgi:phosphoribosylformimino-5-aminoimidazole carboxamide ribotide isomerase
MSDFTIIPAIDLKGGVVVHARGGKREDYRPLATPLGPADDPLAIARALLAITGSPILYVADLDAIEGRGNNFETCRALADALPAATLWIDAGFSDVGECAFWLPLGAILAIGSECLATREAWEDIQASFGGSVLLSLDFDGAGLRGPADLAQPALWSDRLIVMDLGRVGTGQGPDVERLKDIVSRADGRAVYAAGGVRNIDDLEALAETGARGALASTSLHEGRVTQKEIAALDRGRRSQS